MDSQLEVNIGGQLRASGRNPHIFSRLRQYVTSCCLAHCTWRPEATRFEIPGAGLQVYPCYVTLPTPLQAKLGTLAWIGAR